MNAAKGLSPTKPHLESSLPPGPTIVFAKDVRDELDAKRVPLVESNTVRHLNDVDDRNLRTYAMVLLLRNLKGKVPLYRGTVSAKDKASRRRRNKVAKASRKQNR